MNGEIWTADEEARRLAERFATVRQAAFAREFKVPGGPSMITQHIKGNRPISWEAAIAYATGFKCSLDEISPRLAAVTRMATQYLKPDAQTEPHAGLSAPPHLGAALASLATLLSGADPATRDLAAGMLANLARNPENHARVAMGMLAMLGNGGAKFETVVLAPEANPTAG